MGNGWTIYREATNEEAEVLAQFGVEPADVAIQEAGGKKHLISRRNLESVTTFINSLVEGH